jgi:hypothetical protein
MMKNYPSDLGLNTWAPVASPASATSWPTPGGGSLGMPRPRGIITNQLFTVLFKQSRFSRTVMGEIACMARPSWRLVPNPGARSRDRLMLSSGMPMNRIESPAKLQEP